MLYRDDEQQSFVDDNIETRFDYPESYNDVLCHVDECENVKPILNVCMDKPLMVDLLVNNNEMLFEIDTGSPISQFQKRLSRNRRI